MTDQEIVDNAGSTLIFDTENYPNYFLIAFKHLPTGKVIKFSVSKSFVDFNARKLSWILHSYTCVGFNSIKFDMPLIWLSYTTQDLDLLKQGTNDLIGGLFPKEFEKTYGIKIFDTSHIDLIEVCPLRGSLKLYGARLHAKRIQDLPFSPFKPITDEQIEIVDDYCINDLDTTGLAFNNLTEQLQLRYSLTAEYKQNVMSKSDAQIAETVIGTELRKLTGYWPKKPKIDSSNFHHNFQCPPNLFFQTPAMQAVLEEIKQAKFSVNTEGRLEHHEILKRRIPIGNSVYRMGIGGLHSSEENVSHKSDDEHELFDRDVASYYPNIVLNCELFPKHIGENFLTVYRGIVERRLAAKKAKRIAESENLKVTANGTFGKTGSPYSILYAPEMTIQITVGGQLYLLMLIECLELAGIPVVSANTDGILIKCPKDKKEQMLSIIKMWEQITGFETEETKYEAMYSRDVNAYIAVKKTKDGKLEVKGKNVYYDPWKGGSPKDAYWRFQKNPSAQICIEAVTKLLTENIQIEKTINECIDITRFVCVKNVTGGAHKDKYYLGKVIRWYYAKGVVGTINYINTDNKVPDTEGAKPCMDLPDEFPSDINYDWYVDKAKEMLQDMDYIKRPKQVRFF